VTGELGRDYWKPHPLAFKVTAERLGMSRGSALAYVGDNPLKDFVAPNQLGWKTIRLRMNRQLHHELEPSEAAHAPDRECGSLTEVVVCLDRP